MAKTPKILAFAGSLRAGSFNRMLLKPAIDGARAEGAEVSVLDFREYPFPVYDADLEAKGVPGPVLAAKKLFLACDGILIASPEYNGSIPGPLKNFIDWISRTAPGEEPLQCLDGKTISLISASPGGFGGMRALMALRQSLSGLGCLVLPETFSLPRAGDAFGPDGSMKDSKSAARAAAIGADLAQMLKKLGN
jgi:NAD(P)H-dependent FMN reductase